MRVVPRQSDLLGLLHGYIDMLRLRAVAASTTTAALSAGHIRDLFSAIAASRSERGTVGEQSGVKAARLSARSEEHTSELQSLMRISYAVFCLKKKNFD